MTYSGKAYNHGSVSLFIQGPQEGLVKWWPGEPGHYNQDGYASVAMDGGPVDITAFVHTTEQAVAWADAFTAAAAFLRERPAIKAERRITAPTATEEPAPPADALGVALAKETEYRAGGTS